jgi:hypothetical protein
MPGVQDAAQLVVVLEEGVGLVNQQSRHCVLGDSPLHDRCDFRSTLGSGASTFDYAFHWIAISSFDSTAHLRRHCRKPVETEGCWRAGDALDRVRLIVAKAAIKAAALRSVRSHRAIVRYRRQFRSPSGDFRPLHRIGRLEHIHVRCLLAAPAEPMSGIHSRLDQLQALPRRQRLVPPGEVRRIGGKRFSFWCDYQALRPTNSTDLPFG